MKYKCVIIDDEKLARELIENHLSQLKKFEIVASCSSAIQALEILQKERVDLIFLDIEMPQLKGTEFLRNLRNKPKVILTTAYREYALEGYELDVLDYLLKPIVFSRFLKAIEKFISISEDIRNNIDVHDHIYIQSNKKNIKIILNDILYIESVKDYVKIHFDNDNIMFKNGITAFEKKLNSNFLRIHRSYIVNTNRITAFTKKDIEIGKIEIPIGEHFKEKVLSGLN